MEEEAYPAARAAPPQEGNRRKSLRLAAVESAAAVAPMDEVGSGTESGMDE